MHQWRLRPLQVEIIRAYIQHRFTKIEMRSARILATTLHIPETLFMSAETHRRTLNIASVPAVALRRASLPIEDPGKHDLRDMQDDLRKES